VPARRVFAIAVLMISAAACGGAEPETAASSPSASPSPSPSPSPEACATVAPGPVPLCAPVGDGGTVDVTDQGSSVELTIELGPGMKFSPTYVEVAPGAEVTVTVKNLQKQGDFAGTHSFSIESLEVSEVLNPGETSTVTFELPTDEPYVQFFCAIGRSHGAGHQAGGMQGAFYFG
jgi:hypothetical protein